MRTAMVAGGAAAVAHHAGTKSAQAQAQEDAQNQQIADLQQQQQYAAPAPAPASGPTQDNIQKLKELGELHAQGILTDEEFAAQKAKLL
jgi:Short C-terminal domain